MVAKHRAEEKALRGESKQAKPPRGEGGRGGKSDRGKGSDHVDAVGGRGRGRGDGGGDNNNNNDRSSRGVRGGRGARGGRGRGGGGRGRGAPQPKYGVREKKRKSPQLLLKSLKIIRGSHSKSWASTEVKLQLKFFLGKQPKVGITSYPSIIWYLHKYNLIIIDS